MKEMRNTGPVLITGCSSGLGHATALAFHNAGWLTVASARNIHDLASLAAYSCKTVQLDVADETSRREAVAAVEGDYGPIGVLVNNAGYGQYGPLEEMSLDVVRRAFETNVFGLLRLIQLVLPGMREAGRGRIVNISSVAGRVAVPGGGVYHMTKYALEAMADSLRPEVKPFGIDVVNVLPGPFLSRYREKGIATIPHGDADGAYAVYKRNIDHYLRYNAGAGPFPIMSVQRVVTAVVKAGTVPNPRTRYSVGLIATLAPIFRALMPDRFVDAYMNRQIPNG